MTATSHNLYVSSMRTHSHLILGKYSKVSLDSHEKKAKLLRGNHAEPCLAAIAYKKHIIAIVVKQHIPNIGFSATTLSTPLDSKSKYFERPAADVSSFPKNE